MPDPETSFWPSSSGIVADVGRFHFGVRSVPSASESGEKYRPDPLDPKVNLFPGNDPRVW
jgi:hypothetical protein